MGTKQEIREAAETNGWTVTKDLGWAVDYERNANIGPKLAAMQTAAEVEWTPKDTITVYFSEATDKRASVVTEGYLKSFNEQAMIDGRYVGCAAMTEGTGRKAQVLAWITAEVKTTP